MEGQGSARQLAVLWFAGLALRATLLALPPLLPAVSRSLHLGPASLATLANLPVVLLAVAAAGGGALSGAIGPYRAVLAGMVVVAAGGAARGLSGSAASLFATTAVMGVGIAVTQVGLPSLAAEWFPRRIGLATATYGNGMLVAEAAAAGGTLAVVLPLASSWQWALALWSLPVALGVMLALAWGGRRPAATRQRPGGLWPDWRDGRTWMLGLIQAAGSCTYFAINALLPAFLAATGRRGEVGLALGLMNAAQLPASALFLVSPERFLRPWTLGSFAAACAGALVAVPLLGGSMLVVAIVIAGFSSAVVLLASLALAPSLGGTAEASRLSAGMFSLAYSLSFVTPVAGGLVWQESGIARLCLLPAVLVAVVGTGVTARYLPGHLRGRVPGGGGPFS